MSEGDRGAATGGGDYVTTNDSDYVTTGGDYAMASENDRAAIRRLGDDYGAWFLDDDRLAQGRMSDELAPFERLFSPIQVNAVRLKNRIVMGPMGVRRGPLRGEPFRGVPQRAGPDVRTLDASRLRAYI